MLLKSVKEFAVLFVLSSFLWGCAEDHKPALKTRPVNQETTLSVKRSAFFGIPPDLNPDLCTFQLMKSDSLTLFYAFDPFTLQLFTYAFENGNLLPTQLFTREGPDGLGNNTMHLGFFALSPDTFLFHNYYQRRLYFFDRSGHKLHSFKLPSPDSCNCSLFVAHSPPVKVGRKIIFPNMFQGTVGGVLIPSEKIPAYMELDMDSMKMAGCGRRSTKYDRGYNIAGDKSYSFVAYDHLNDELLISWRQDPMVHIYRQCEPIRQIAIFSNYFEEPPAFSDEFEKGRKMESVGHLLVRIYIRTSPNFDRVLFDANSSTFWRFTFLPRTREEYESNPMGYVNSMLVTNLQTGETIECKLPTDTYDIQSAQSWEGGIWLRRLDGEAEDSMRWDLVAPLLKSENQ